MYYHSFLGPIGGPEIIMILLVLGIPVVIVVVVLLIVKASSGSTQAPYPMSAAPPPLPSPQSRLLEIDSLKEQGLISEAEHAEKRRKILEGI